MSVAASVDLIFCVCAALSTGSTDISTADEDSLMQSKVNTKTQWECYLAIWKWCCLGSLSLQVAQVRVIVSGVGDYRYVDCVAIKAGKQEALEYIRALFNIQLSHCMAAGDSGNDILMLEGMCID